VRIFYLLILSAVYCTQTVSAAFVPNDTYLNEQWYVETLELTDVWDISQGQGSVIAIIDSGIALDHPDLQQSIWVNQGEIAGDGIDNDKNGYIDDVQGWDFHDNDNDPRPFATVECFESRECDYDAHVHGTVIAGVVAAQIDNAQGIAGIAPKAKIMPLRVLDSTGYGDSGLVIQALEYAINNGADVVNMSFVGPFNDEVLEGVINEAYSRGVAVVIAAGNSEGSRGAINLTTDRRYPVCNDNGAGEEISLGVGAHDATLRLSDFSNYGDCIDLIAPGDDIFSTVVRDESLGFLPWYDEGWRGTSLAAPVVGAGLALLNAVDPSLGVGEAYSLLLATATNVDIENQEHTEDIGRGALNIKAALTLLSSALSEVDEGRRITALSTSAVYYIAGDGKRYVFPDQGTYASWFDSFEGIEVVSDEELASYPLGGIVKYKPASHLVKIQSIPQVYAVEKGGVLRWVQTESVARQLFGADWASQVVDIDDSFFVNYSFGEDINSASDYSVIFQKYSAQSINVDLGL
jgi:subtilisin family serine protease